MPDRETSILYIYELLPMDEWSHTVPPLTWIQASTVSGCYALNRDHYYGYRDIVIPSEFHKAYIADVFQWLIALKQWSTDHCPAYLPAIEFLELRFFQLQATTLWEGDGTIGMSGFPAVDIYEIIPTIFIKQNNHGSTWFLTPYAVPILAQNVYGDVIQIPAAMLFPRPGEHTF